MAKSLTTLVSTVLLAFLVTVGSGCGEDRSNLLPQDQSRQIQASLSGIQKLADENQCFLALKATKNLLRQVERLPQSVDSDLKRSLLDGVVALQLLIGDPSKCTDDTTAEPVTTEPEPDTGVTTTGDTGVTSPEETQPDQEKGKGKQDGGNQPGPQTPDTTPDPQPTPETPPTTEPPTGGGSGSGGVGPNQ